MLLQRPGRNAGLMQVLVYDAATRKLKAQFTRFKDKAYGGCFRADGKLLVAGGESGLVQASPNLGVLPGAVWQNRLQ